MSQEKLKKIHVHFSFSYFFFLEGGEVTGAGGRKRRIKMVDGLKKSFFAWLKSVS